MKLPRLSRRRANRPPRAATNPADDRQSLQLNDIQGNILKGYHHEQCAYLFYRVDDPHAARAFLGEWADVLQTAADKPAGVAVNLAITWAGLAALQVPAIKLQRLPQAFRQGMTARAAELGDPTAQRDGRPVPVGWHSPFGDDDLHLLLTVSGTRDQVNERVTALSTEMWQSGISRLDGAIRGTRLPDDVEHFGFVDGLSNPPIEGVSYDQPPTQAAVRAGEFVLGMLDEGGAVEDEVPSITRNGSYLVLRKLEQDIDAFEQLVSAGSARTGFDERVIRAKLIGRWPGGAPLTEHRDAEPDTWSTGSFDYTDDDGIGCPLGSHIRRANPRGGLEFEGSLEKRHRILRRGLPYGTPGGPKGPDGGTGYGLVFACFQADIAGQFEFVQSRWLGDGNVFALGTDTDPISERVVGGRLQLEGGIGAGDGPASPPSYVEVTQPCVTSRGGEYFLVPSISAVRAIANLSELYAPTEDTAAGFESGRR